MRAIGPRTPVACLALTACISASSASTQPGREPANQPALAFSPAPSVLPTGSFQLDRVETETLQHGMEMTASTTTGISVQLEIMPDGTAWSCATHSFVRRSDVSKYASRSGEHEHTEDNDVHKVGRAGRVTADGSDLVITFTRTARDCDRAQAQDWDGASVRCTLGRLDGHDALACEPSPLLGGERALLPFDAGRVLLGRNVLRANYTHRGTTVDPPDQKPDKGDPSAWVLSW